MPDYSGYLHMDEEHTRRDLGEDELVSRLANDIVETERLGLDASHYRECRDRLLLYREALEKIVRDKPCEFEARDIARAALSQVR